MTKFLVVLSDSEDGSIPSGHALAAFLRVFAHRQTRVVKLKDLLVGPVMETEHLFIALPSKFGPTHAARLRWKRLVLFDFFDEIEPVWQYSNQDFLSSLTDCYAKTHTVDGVNIGFRTGTLPLPINPSLRREVRRASRRRWLSRLGVLRVKNRIWDASFLGSTTYLWLDRQRYHQRVDWLREIHERRDIRFWGGLVELPYCKLADLESECGAVDGLMWTGKKLSFRQFFANLSRTRVSLAPAGHSRWTYRHVESVYAQCAVVSCDLAGVNTLLPLPTQLLAMVPDRAAMMPVLENVLSRWSERADERAAALEHFEQYLLDGCYDVRRPALFERFISQWGD